MASAPEGVPVKRINRLLAERFGYEADGKPKFRLTWSTGELEWRAGTFAEFYGNIFLRETSGIKQVEKYNFCKDRWVLEKLVYLPNPLVPSAVNGSYEPFWVFQDSNGNPKEVWWEAIEFLIKTALTYDPSSQSKNWDAIEHDAFEKEKAYFADILKEDEVGPIEAGEGVSLSGLEIPK